MLFGLLLQVLLLESLDRELGQDTLALTLSVGEGGLGFHDVRVYYRPVQEQQPDAEQQRAPAYDLGPFDRVIDCIAQQLGIMPAGLTFDSDGQGFWSAAMLRLSGLGMISLSPSGDRYVLRTDFLDRLHGGGLMAGVLRRGKMVRDRIRSRLHDLWSEVNDAHQQVGEFNG
jgi:hypothetical protein